MPLIPGTLPSDTCYGTPQQLLQLFAQYLDIPAFSVSSKVLYSDTSPAPVNDLLWIDSVAGQVAELNVFNIASTYYEPYPFSGMRQAELDPANYSETFISGKSVAMVGLNPGLQAADNFLVSQSGTFNKLKRTSFTTLVTSIASSSSFVVTYPRLSTSSTVADNVAARTAKVWVNFDGTSTSPIAPREAFNVSTVSRTGTGAFSITFPTMTANTFCYLVHCEAPGAVASALPIVCRSSSYATGAPGVNNINLYFYEAFTSTSANPVNPRVVTFALFSKD